MSERLVYIPQDHDSHAVGNSYTKSMMRAWRALGFVPIAVAPGLKGLLSHVAFRSETTGVFNWVENGMVRNGRVSARGICRYLLSLVKYRVVCARLVQVRHNVYPHAAAPGAARWARRIIDLAERIFFDFTAVHSGHALEAWQSYVPHPLYCFGAESARPPATRRMILFGRLEPYTRLESVIAAWRDDVELLIAGVCRDPNYLEELRAKAAGRNITFVPGSLSDDDARDLVTSCAAVIVAHGGGAAIVSGSLYFALSCGVPCVAIGLEHARWLAGRGIPGVLYLQGLGELARLDLDAVARMDRHAILSAANEHFGPAALEAALRRLMAGDRRCENVLGGKEERGDCPTRTAP